MLAKCVLNILELSWYQRLGDKKNCPQALTSPARLRNSSFHVVDRTRTVANIQRMKTTRANYVAQKCCFLVLRAIFSECRESEDSHEKSIFLLFRQNIPLGELIQGKAV